MEVIQPTKYKVLNFRELYEQVTCHTGRICINVCGKTMQKWRQMCGENKATSVYLGQSNVRMFAYEDELLDTNNSIKKKFVGAVTLLTCQLASS